MIAFVCEHQPWDFVCWPVMRTLGALPCVAHIRSSFLPHTPVSEPNAKCYSDTE